MSVPTGLWSLALAAGAEAPTPPPTPEEFTIYNVTPGISGFLAFFVMALVGWLLFRSLVRHVRKVDVAAAQRTREEAAAAKTGEPHDGDAAADADERRDQPTE